MSVIDPNRMREFIECKAGAQKALADTELEDVAVVITKNVDGQMTLHTVGDGGASCITVMGLLAWAQQEMYHADEIEEVEED